MKERLILFIIMAGLSAFLYVYQYHFNTIWGLAFLILCMSIYSIYMILADKHKRRKLKKNPQVINQNYKPFVTIMVPAHNESSVIMDTVENILNIDYPNYELIIIDDRSTDNTAEILRMLENKHANVKALIREKHAFPGKSAVLNDAMQLAEGEAILVFDADARVEPDFLLKLVPHLEADDVGAVQARKVISNRDVNFLTRCQDNEMTLDTHFQIGRDAVKGAVELRGNGELIKRKALEDIDGWNNYTLVDDLDMSTRLHIKGWDIRFCPDVEVREEAVVYLKALYRQRRRWYEGTIRRYLELFGEVLNSKKMSLRASLDMTAYISEFVMPMWFTLEVVIRLFKVLTGKVAVNDIGIFTSIIIGVVIGICFTLATRYSLRKYNHLGRLQALKQAVETSAYILAIWFPIAFYISLKIIFLPKDMNWGKTTHGLILEEAEKENTKEKEKITI
ncbi:glycosyltransferase family 2 protein [bacterium]|nr:glycosyltransferase family 2 protein [bacterium]